MTNYNLVMVIHPDETKLLTLRRTENPYLGLYNLPGGKIESGETLLDSAYRELEEETGISKRDIQLQPFMDFVWHSLQMKMFVFIGKLNHDQILVEEKHPLEWHGLDENFFDMKRYAGEGNIGHMVEIYRSLKNQ
jgi:8-oxo-dGTP diphosphatase